MGKKKKKKYEFKFPEFDEKGFIEKERVSAKITFISVFFAIVMGFISFFLSKLKFEIGFLIGILGMFALKFLFLAFKIDVSKIEKKNWIGTTLTYFFAWLAIWVLIVNTI